MKSSFDVDGKEYLDHQQIRQTILVPYESLSVAVGGEIHPSHEDVHLLDSRKRKLDQLLSSATSSTRAGETETARHTKSSIQVLPPQNHSDDADPSCMPTSLLVDNYYDNDDDEDDDSGSSSDPCRPNRCTQATSLPDEPPLLPPSTGNIGVPEDVVPFLFSVFNFLRSFSQQLFLSPFGLDDFVGSLNCHIQNTLLDAIHVSLMRALRQHLKISASEGSQLAFRCLQLLDWNLLDTLTWPIFLMEYISIMRLKKHIKDYGGFQTGILDGEYYSLPVSSKLMALQIICDNLVESGEIRDELEMRENMDEEKEHIAKPSLCIVESMPRRLHPRYSKTSACRDTGDVENAVKEDIRCTGLDAWTVDVDKDGNSDECQLCRMDGTLICCDGCPSSYHSRCIGLNKASLPEGSWFCPECLVRKICTASSKISTGIRGGEIFGVDPFGRVFLGTCNYLVVFGVSHGINSISRYYSYKDIGNVLKFLCVERETSYHYADICHAISLYWDIPLSHFLQPVITNVVSDPSVEKDSTRITSYCSSEALPNLQYHGDNYASGIPKISAVKEEVLYQHHANSVSASCLTDSLGCNQADQSSQKWEMACNEVSPKKKVEPGDEILVSQTGEVALQNASVVRSNILLTESVCCDPCNVPMNSADKQKLLTDISNSQQLKFMGRSLLACDSFDGSRDGSSGNYMDVGCYYDSHDNKFSYLGTRFKHQAYINQYFHGEVAASAAANLSFLSSEECKASATQASSNPKRALAATAALQVKAFSGATMHFKWPSFEKKIVDVPRERCGWCISCKSASTCKKGCLLNTAITNTVRGASRATSSLRLLKSENGHFHAIGAYILHMEENLRGMIEGPLLDANYKIWWRKSVGEACTCQELKFLLLELERNIRGITFSAGWLKLVDNWSVELKSGEASVGFSGTFQKRGIGGRRSKRQTMTSEVLSIDSDRRKEFQWWCESRLAKKLFQMGILPRLLTKRIARQGGSKHVEAMGICYPDHSETANRTRQIVWRTAVELSKNSSQLALQVRYLDAHIRWKDLVCPEQNTFEERTADIESSTFRNAVIFEEKIVENKTRYALSFSSQMHLPLRVTKNVLEAEHYEDEKEKLWFSENYVPLYLIKEYKENVRGPDVPYSREVTIGTIPELLIRQLRVIRKDIFLYLFHKGKEPQVYSCVSCKRDVLLRNAVSCMACQGYSHKHCLITSSDCLTGGWRHICVCRSCHSSESCIPAENHATILKDRKAPAPKIKGLSPINSSLQFSTPKVDSELVACPSGLISEQEGKSKTKSRLTSGLIWKRKKTGDKNEKCGIDFRLKHLILKGSALLQTLGEEPVCKLCSTSYNPDLMYIRCEHCLCWYHADSLQLEENQIFDLIGFRCCKCRRRACPYCPHSIKTDKKLRLKPAMQRNARKLHGGRIMEPAISNTKDLPKKCHLKPEETEGPSFPSSNSVSSQAIYDNGSCEAPVADSINPGILGEHLMFPMGIDADKHFGRWGCSSLVSDADGTMSDVGEEKSSKLDLDFPRTDDKYVNINASFAYKEGNSCSEDLSVGEVTEYEPQTYFSFTELLASDNEENDPQHSNENENVAVSLGYREEVGSLGNSSSSYHTSNTYLESSKMGLMDKHNVALDGEVCQRCNLSEVAPDVLCEDCGTIIHLQCSPWEEKKGASVKNGKWRCGDCRE